MDENIKDLAEKIIKDAINEQSKNSLGVKIISNNDSASLSRMPVTLTHELNGEYEKELQYHWILENDGKIEGFVIPESGPQKEIINSGDPVELDVFADISYVDGAFFEFKVKLQVEGKETLDIIATDEITIENREGIYNIK